MKRRGWRVALTVATLGLALVGALVAFNWGVVRDHVEAWWFQATTETKAIAPDPHFLKSRKREDDLYVIGGIKELACLLASTSGHPIVAKSHAFEGQASARWSASHPSMELALSLMSDKGYRVVEQRLPRPAYVIVEYPEE